MSPNIDDYLEPLVYGGHKFTTAFYELSLSNKYRVFEMIMDTSDQRPPIGLESDSETSVYNRFILALLQHSPRLLRRDYPVLYERRPNKIARDADIEELVERLLLTLGTVVIP